MLYLENEHTDPRINLAIEEHLACNVKLDDAVLFFSVTEPSVLIGRNQNTIEEIDVDYVREKGIHVVRRLSGGGAVYNDFGSLIFSFISNIGADASQDMQLFTYPLVGVLGELDVYAEVRGKSSIFANAKKISGNAQYVIENHMVSHGTLLFDSDIKQMLKVLNPQQLKIESKAVRSVRSFVTNVRELLPRDITIYELKEALLKGIFLTDDMTEVPRYNLTEADWEQINKIVAERYSSWDWNYGSSPKFNLQKSGRIASVKVDIRLDVDGGRIQSAKIFGDFAGERPVDELELKLAGVRYDSEALTEALEDIDLALYLGLEEKADFIDLLF